MRIAILILLLTSLLWAEVKPEDLTYMTENYPPNNYLDEYGILQGSSVEIIREMWKNMGIEAQEIHVYPWARAYQNIQTKEKQVLFTMSKSEAREKLFKWVGPLSSSKHLLVGISKKQGDTIQINSLMDVREGYSIGVVREDVGQQILIQKGIPEAVQKEAVTIKDIIQQLNDGKVDLISIGYEAYISMSQKSNNPHKYYIAYTIDTSQDYIAFSKDIPDTIIERYRTALHNIKKEHLQILKRYNLKVFPDTE